MIRRRTQVGTPLARSLAWFGIALGAAELGAPRTIAALLGIEERQRLLRLLGLREIASGLGILSGRPAPWMWSRVGGDAVDLALLGAALATATGAARRRIAAATAAVAGVTYLDVHSGQQLAARERNATPDGALRARCSVSINRPAADLYRTWRDLEGLPRFMWHIESVRRLDERRSHWVAKGPAGTRLEWDAAISEDEPERRLAWRSLPGATVESRGSVEFRPGKRPRDTIVMVELEYEPPGGAVAALVAEMMGAAPEQTLKEDLRRFRQLMETGEIPTTDGQSSGRATTGGTR